MNKIKKIAGVVCLYVLFSSLQSLAVPIPVVQGGIPFANPQQMMEEGIRLGNKEYLRKAWKLYEDGMNFESSEKEGYYELGKIYFHLSLLGVSTEEEFQTARQYVTRALRDSPADASLHQAKGLIYAGRGAFLQAMEELSLALTLNPGNELVICDLAALHLALQQPKKTIELLEGKNLKNGWSYLVLAMAWLQQDAKGRAMLNLLKAKKLGYHGYWVDRALQRIAREYNLPLNY